MKQQLQIEIEANENYRRNIKNGSGRCPGCGDRTSYGPEDKGSWCYPCKNRYSEEERKEIVQRRIDKFMERLNA